MLISCIVIGVVISICVFQLLHSKQWPDITSPLWNDTLFTNKNKSYGAYTIRNQYNKTLSFILLALVASITAPILPLLFQREITIHQTDHLRVASVQHVENFTEFDKDSDNKHPGQKGRKNENTPQRTPTSSEAFTNVQQLLRDTVPQKSEGKSGSSDDVHLKKRFHTLSHRLLHESKTDENGVPDSIPFPAHFRGGDAKLFEFVSEYAKVQPKGRGTVEVQFLIDRYGNIKKIWIEQENKNCPQCDRAAIAVVKQMPAWEPARLNNTPVNSYHRLKISFR